MAVRDSPVLVDGVGKAQLSQVDMKGGNNLRIVVALPSVPVTEERLPFQQSDKGSSLFHTGPLHLHL